MKNFLEDDMADVVAKLMQDAGYDASDIETTSQMLRKEGLKRDASVQALEDVICFVFLKWYFAPFAAKHAEDKIQNIVEKTARVHVRGKTAGARFR